MIKFTLFKMLNTTAFFVALCIGLLFCYITNPPPQIIMKYPQEDQKIYTRPDGSKYRLVLKKIDCPKDYVKVEEMREKIMESF